MWQAGSLSPAQRRVVQLVERGAWESRWESNGIRIVNELAICSHGYQRLDLSLSHV